jgi:hypothetical protein
LFGALIATGSYDSYLVELDPSLAHLDSRSFMVGLTIALDPAGMLLLGGAYTGMVCL